MAKNNFWALCGNSRRVYGRCTITRKIGHLRYLFVLPLLTMLPSIADAYPLTLQDAINKAVSEDEWLTSSFHKEVALRELSQGSTSLPDPKVSLGLLNMPTDSFDFNQEAMTQLSFSISQTFPAGDTLRLMGEKYSALGDQMPLERDNRRAILTMEVSKLWLSAYQYEESMKLVLRNKKLFEQLHDVVESSYSSAYGAAKQQDLVRSELELIKLDHRLAELQQGRRHTLSKLMQYISLAPNEKSSIDDGIQLVGEGKIIRSLLSPQPYSAGDLSKRLLQHPMVKVVEAKSSSAQIDKALAEQKYEPQWGISLGYGYRGDDPSGNSRADLASVVASVSLPIFSSRSQDAQVKAAALKVESIVSEKQLVLNELRAKYLSLTSDIESLEGRVELYQSQLIPSYQQSVQTTLNAYTSNDGFFTEVVQARIAILNAQIELLSIRVERLKRLAELNYVLASVAEEVNK
ncbi:TolC family protein [Marinomonas sp. C2222]|uniref:TolC family protein n=1 Tax=Marinomonas sargassi TaxID=2984494 RepID=A0ABT2YW51_9GAMM|nr:TolC family protein [Marinomonas sargassi]MCV2404122.1 TolC family protein [Marinomonas sargassi]